MFKNPNFYFLHFHSVFFTSFLFDIYVQKKFVTSDMHVLISLFFAYVVNYVRPTYGN